MEELKKDMQMSCMVVDDEPFALKLISEDVSRLPFLNLKGTFSSAGEAHDFLLKESVDLIFLDIQMPELTGTSFLRSLKNPPLVIFVTAYEEYALEGFELDVIDYLVKPVPFERFKKAAEKAYHRWTLVKEYGTAEAQFFFIRAEYKEIKILFDDILYIEGLKDYVKIFLASQTRPLFTRLNLKAISAKLPAHRFCRVHNSYIVPLNKITASQRSQIYLGAISIPVGDKYAASFREQYEASR